MAQSKNNVITHGLSGKVGNLVVFSQRKGKTIVSRVPRKKAGLTPNQIAHQEQFLFATGYAKAAIVDPVLKIGYELQAQLRGITPYNCAVGDYLTAPQITNVNKAHYFGIIGNKILIRAIDDFQVKSVFVRIEEADGTLVEEGPAAETLSRWEYVATVLNTAMSGGKIIVKATDLPGNETVKEVLL